MTTDKQMTSVAVLDEAEAIVDAELHQLAPPWDQRESELAEFLAELPSSAPGRHAASNTNTNTSVRRTPTATPRRQGQRSDRCDDRGTDSVGHAAVPPGCHGSTKDPTMFSRNGGDALTGAQAMTRAGPQQSHHRVTRRTIKTRCARTPPPIVAPPGWTVRDVIAHQVSLPHQDCGVAPCGRALGAHPH